MAAAVVDTGLSFRDFCRLTFDEMEEVLRVSRERREQTMRDEWERMRMHAVMTMQPHCKKRLSPQTLLKFPWEKKRMGQRNSTPTPNKDQAKEAFLARIHRSDSSKDNPR